MGEQLLLIQPLAPNTRYTRGADTKLWTLQQAFAAEAFPGEKQKEDSSEECQNIVSFVLGASPSDICITIFSSRRKHVLFTFYILFAQLISSAPPLPLKQRP